jgi:hypothetical protein
MAREEPVKKFLIVSILVVLVIILITPFFIRRAQLSFTQTPLIRLDYIDNRTVYNVYSVGDSYYSNITAIVTWTNGSDIARETKTTGNDYFLSGATQRLSFNLTILAIDRSDNRYTYVGDFNISKVTLKERFYVFMNVTEHSTRWIKRDVMMTDQNLPYRTSLEELKKEGEL